MNIEMLPLFSFVMVTTFTPGPNNISSASMGVLYGFKKTLVYLAGIAAGFFIVMIVSAFLSGALLNIIPVVKGYLRWVGAGYILWLAVGTLRSSYSFSESNGSVTSFSKGFVLQLINPKVAVYGLTLYSTFLSPISDRLDYLFISAVVFATTAFVATSLWALFGSVIKMKLKNNSFRKAINTTLSFLLIYTAIELSGILSQFGNG